MPSTAFHSLPQCAARRVRRSGAGLRVQYRLHTRRLAFKLQLLSPAMQCRHVHAAARAALANCHASDARRLRKKLLRELAEPAFGTLQLTKFTEAANIWYTLVLLQCRLVCFCSRPRTVHNSESARAPSQVSRSAAARVSAPILRAWRLAQAGSGPDSHSQGFGQDVARASPTVRAASVLTVSTKPI